MTTPKMAVISGMPAASSEPSVIASTKKATIMPIDSDPCWASSAAIPPENSTCRPAASPVCGDVGELVARLVGDLTRRHGIDDVGVADRGVLGVARPPTRRRPRRRPWPRPSWPRPPWRCRRPSASPLPERRRRRGRRCRRRRGTSARAAPAPAGTRCPGPRTCCSSGPRRPRRTRRTATSTASQSASTRRRRSCDHRPELVQIRCHCLSLRGLGTGSEIAGARAPRLQGATPIRYP